MQSNLFSLLFAARANKEQADTSLPKPAPRELDVSVLKDVAGGKSPNGTWSTVTTASSPNGTW